MLQDAPSDIIRWLLIALKVGTDPQLTLTWPVYAKREPNAPDDVLTVYGTDGQDDGRVMLDGQLLYHYGFQVRIRSADPQTGYMKASAIRDALATGVYRTVIAVGPNSYTVHCIAKIGSVMEIGYDSPNSQRSVHTLNALFTVR